jgi:hypothetical protein
MADTTIRKAFILATLLATLAISGHALTIGVSPAEGMDRAPAPEGLGSPMGYLVSGCLSALFDSGYVATDAAVSRTSRGSWGPSSYGLAEAREGQVDYLIAFFVEWAQSSYHKEAALPATITYRLVRTRDGTSISEGSFLGPEDSEATSSHEARSASLAGISIVEPCVKLLSTLAMGGE